MGRGFDVGGPHDHVGMETTIADEAEHYLRDLEASLLAPTGRECLVCYLQRMLFAFGCADTLRFVRHYRDLRTPRATTLERRLVARGGECDCRVFLEVYTPARPLRLPGLAIAAPDLDAGADAESSGAPAELRPCASVGHGSAQPCTHWRRVRFGGG
ncbi:hypothetical protein QE411_002447 [Microbacterium arborescens]|nr:hypothetical protein [Microbacterium arborescens]